MGGECESRARWERFVTPWSPAAPAPPPAPAVDRGADQWFWDHYDWAVGELIAFLAEDGFDLTGCDVADVGCGDGIIDLGLVHRVQPRRLVGFDVNPVREDLLLERAAAARVADELPPSLEFTVCEAEKLPAADDAFDAVVTWSAFEHIDDPSVVLTEIRRVLRPDGVLFLQLWPFYGSQHGAHLDDWYPDGFVQYQRDADAIERDVLERAENHDWAAVQAARVPRAQPPHARRARPGARRRRVPRRASSSSSASECGSPPRSTGWTLSRLGISGVMLLAH